MNISSLSKKSKSKLQKAKDLRALESSYTDLLGKNGEINLLLKSLGKLPQEKRKNSGKALNELKSSLEAIFQSRRNHLKEKIFSEELKRDSLDVTLPGRTRESGTLHPVTSTIIEISNFFVSMGFDIRSGPEAESEYYNFEALNIPEDHPAKDMHDTFYLDNGVLLRTHTSPVQIRTMEKQDPPIRIISPGRVYRKDSDLTHTPMFHMIEGLVLEENASFSVLKGMLKDFINDFFGNQTELRFRPSYFPFTEPSAEVDIKWKKGWLEILGCGMVHPNVLEMSGINSKKYSGFAFGLGPERMAMLKYNIPDLRSFFENDLRFLKQFK
ncbi:MAG TPA: phenylalanine--tRNA ligase subunit alpha [Gammaproteobacteria bacterium]|nr:phenylalanine--tRNA ligase subunit alpha [Gammaproteobacteria bacterium]